MAPNENTNDYNEVTVLDIDVENVIMDDEELDYQFTTAFRALKNGNDRIPMQFLHHLALEVGLEMPLEDLEELADSLFPDVTEYTLEQAHEIYNLAIKRERKQTEAVTKSIQVAATSNTVAQNTTSWIARHVPKRLLNLCNISDSTMLKGTPLLIAVLCVLILTVFPLAGMAIALQWDDSQTKARDSMLKQATLLKYVVDSQYQQTIKSQVDSLSKQTQIISQFSVGMGWNSTIQVISQEMLRTVSILRETIETVASTGGVNTQKDMLLTTLSAISAFINSSWSVMGKNSTVNVIDSVNDELSWEYEIVMAYVTPPSNVQLLTKSNSNRKRLCATGLCEYNGTYALDSYSPMEPFLRGIKGISGTLMGVDYTDRPCLIAYQYVTVPKVVLVVKKQIVAVRDDIVESLVKAMNRMNLGFATSTEITIGEASTSNYLGYNYLTSLRYTVDCSFNSDSSNRCQPSEPMLKALNQEIGYLMGKDYRGSDVIGAYAPIESLALGLVIKVDLVEIRNSLQTKLSGFLDIVNDKLFTGTMEAILATPTVSNATNQTSLRFLTNTSVPNCYNQSCSVRSDSAIYRATAKMETTSISNSMSYRSVPVSTSFTYLSGFQTGLAINVDITELTQAAINATKQIVEDINSAEVTSQEILLGLKDDSNDIYLVNQPRSKCSDDCVSSTMEKAVAGNSGSGRGSDYRGVDAVFGYTYSPITGVGVLVKIDYKDLQDAIMRIFYKMVGGSIGFIVFGIVITFLVAQKMLKRMRSTWKSKLQLEDRVTRIEKLLSSMYPKDVADHMLKGHKRIVEYVPDITCVMVDIHHFTYLSNNLKPEDLVDLLGYTFNVCDTIADYYGVYKVKTIGDCYMGLAGLPNFFDYPEGHVMGTLHFGATVLQVFSELFIHPPTGSVMGKVINLKQNDRSSVPKVTNSVTGSTHEKESTSDTQSSHTSSSSNSDNRRKANKTYSMRIGVACGPSTVGVLPGKTPLFDCWGPTINLAARLESSGSPSFMQCSEEIYNRIRELKSPYTFDRPRSIYAKGFGNVTAYLVNRTTHNVPLELIENLGLQVDFKEFAFGTMAGPKVTDRWSMANSHYQSIIQSQLLEGVNMVGVLENTK